MGINSYINVICKIGQGKDCCKYLIMGKSGFECAKFTTSTKLLIDKNWNPQKVAQGDNCAGKPSEKLN